MSPEKSVHFLFIYVYRKSCFVCNSMGNGPIEGTFLYFEELKGLLFKNALIFFFFFNLIFAKKSHATIPDIIKLIPLGASTSKYKKSAFSL